MFILSLILLERWSRRQARYYQTSSPFQRLSTYQLEGGTRAVGLVELLFTHRAGVVDSWCFTGADDPGEYGRDARSAVFTAWL